MHNRSINKRITGEDIPFNSQPLKNALPLWRVVWSICILPLTVSLKNNSFLLKRYLQIY